MCDVPTRDLNTVLGGLRAVWDTRGRAFVSLESEADEDCFVQYLDGVLNIAWPFDEAPAERLRRARIEPGPGSFPLPWSGGSTAQWAVGDVRIDDLAPFIVALLRDVLRVPARISLVARVADDR